MVNRFTHVRLNKALSVLSVEGKSDPALVTGSTLDIAIIAEDDADNRLEPPVANPGADPWRASCANAPPSPFAPFAVGDKVYVVGAARAPSGDVFLWGELKPIKAHDAK